MKLTAIVLMKWNGDKDAHMLGVAANLSSFGFFQRGAVREMMIFVARTVAKRTQPGQRQTVQQVCPLSPLCSTHTANAETPLHLTGSFTGTAAAEI